MSTQRRVQAPTTGQDDRLQRRLWDEERNLDRLNRVARMQGGTTWHPGPHIYDGTTLRDNTANRVHIGECSIKNPCTLTGIHWQVGSVSAGNVKAGLWDAAGNRLAQTTATVAVAAAGVPQSVPFSAPIDVLPGLYWIGVGLSSATCDYTGGHCVLRATFNDPGSFIIPATITPGTAGATSFFVIPVMSTY